MKMKKDFILSRSVSNKVIKIDGALYRVYKYNNDIDLDQCNAYTLSDINRFVYPYRGEVLKKKEMYQPGIYKCKGKIYIIRPHGDEERAIYDKSRVCNLTPESIFQQLDLEFDEVPESVLMDGDVFRPKIHEDDDILMAGMKYAIANKNEGKGINFNAYGPKFQSVATKNNARRNILQEHSLKVSMATRYCDVFDINMLAAFWDKDGCKNPITPKGKKRLYVIFNDDSIDIKDPELEIVPITKDMGTNDDADFEE